MKKIILILFGLTLLVAMPAVAVDEQFSITLEPIADSMVSMLTPDINYPSDPNIQIYRHGNSTSPPYGIGQPCMRIRNLFARYQLPDGLTGQDIGQIIVGTAGDGITYDVKITTLPGSSAGQMFYYVYGVNDGLDTNSCNTYTWNNAPGFNPADILCTYDYVHYWDNTEASCLGAISLAYYPPDTTGMYTAGTFGNMVNWLLADTDGILTIFLTGYYPYSYINKYFASIENTDVATDLELFPDGTYPPVTLSFTYTLVPQACGEPGNSTYFPADFNQDCYVTFADLDAFADYWLACTDRANPACQ